jgi:ACR3 family arsenite efflux pump ArsB
MKNNNETFDWSSQDALLMYILLVFIVVSKFYSFLDKIETAVSNSISAWKIVALVVLILAVPIVINVIIYFKIGKRLLKNWKKKNKD